MKIFGALWQIWGRAKLVEKVLSYKRKAKNGRGEGRTYSEISEMVGGVSHHTVGEIFRTFEKRAGVARP